MVARGREIVSLALMCVLAMDANRGRYIVGGECSYRTYEGTATITAVERIADSGEGGGEFAITYVFHPNDQETVLPSHITGRSFSLSIGDGRPPTKHFVDTHRIVPGARIPCKLKIITRGVCTPTLFVFPWDPSF